MFRRFPFFALALLALLVTQCRAELLTRNEGQAVADAALRHGQSYRGEDCSHLAHDIYQSAGLSYDYASSTSLYNGDPAFERVSSPQPGDLVVWRGHVGIVVNPEDATFYSSLSKGPGTDSYESRYWLSRGPARFYRYDNSDNDAPHTVTASASPPQAPTVSHKEKTAGSFAHAIGRLIWPSRARRNFARSTAISIAPTIYLRAR